MQPQPFGLYTLINRINVGGMAEVFKACYYDQGRPAFAAIKRILPHLAQDMSFINMFITEAHTAGRLVHPNIAQIIEQGEEEGEYFISMEYVSGRDLLYLRHHLRERGMYFPPALAAYAIQGVASALDYAHRLCDVQGQHLEIIHRDVSPQNILISYEGEVKLIDFGIAKAKVRTQEHTRAGVLKGKFGYMSPEQVKGQKIDHRIDIFALGTVFYELLTNQRLFMGESDIETLEMVRSAHVTPPSQLNEWVPPLLDQIVMRALQADPAQRFQSAGEMAQALQYFIHNEAPMTHQTTLKSWMAKEFSTFIAHEKAQDAYLVDQMITNLEDSAEDLDSTSLISSEVIDQLNQYTAEQLSEGVVTHETAEQSVEGLWHNEWPTGPMSEDDLAGLDTSPPQSSNALTTENTPVKGEIPSHIEGQARLSNKTVPVSAEVIQHIENEYSAPSFPEDSSHLSAAPITQRDHIDHDDLEELLGEPFDEELLEDDESSIYTQKPNLDEILSASLSQGAASPLISPASSFNASQPPMRSLSAAQQSPLFQRSLSAAQQSPLTQGSLSAAQQSPLAQESLSAAQQYSPDHIATPPIFSDYEPTPIPDMRRSAGPKRARSSRGLMIAFLILFIGGGGGATAWMLMPRESDLKLIVSPPSDQITVQVGMNPPVRLAQQDTFKLSTGESLRVQHPQLPMWTRELTAGDLERGQLSVNLEESAPQMMLKVDSNRAGAEVWVLGKVRGVTPFHALVPVGVRSKQRGRLRIKVTHSSAPPIEKEVKLRRGEFRTWARF